MVPRAGGTDWIVRAGTANRRAENAAVGDFVVSVIAITAIRLISVRE